MLGGDPPRSGGRGPRPLPCKPAGDTARQRPSAAAAAPFWGITTILGVPASPPRRRRNPAGHTWLGRRAPQVPTYCRAPTRLAAVCAPPCAHFAHILAGSGLRTPLRPELGPRLWRTLPARSARARTYRRQRMLDPGLGARQAACTLPWRPAHARMPPGPTARRKTQSARRHTPPTGAPGSSLPYGHPCGTNLWNAPPPPHASRV